MSFFGVSFSVVEKALLRAGRAARASPAPTVVARPRPAPAAMNSRRRRYSALSVTSRSLSSGAFRISTDVLLAGGEP